MSTYLDKTSMKKSAVRYFFASIFLYVFHLIYSIFAHGVDSPFMMYAFAITLVFGSLISVIMIFTPKETKLGLDFRQMGVATLVIGSLLRGVFDIYGTEVALVQVFFYLGGMMLLVSATLYILELIRVQHEMKPEEGVDHD